MANRDQEMVGVFYEMPSQESDTPGKDIGSYFKVIRRRKWLLLTVLCIILPLVVIKLLRQEHIYKATATLLINSVNPRFVNIKEVQSPDSSQDYYRTQYTLITSPPILDSVIDELQVQQEIQTTEEDAESSRLMVIVDSVIDFPQKALRAIRQQLEGNRGIPPPNPAAAQRRRRIAALRRSITVEPISGTRLVNIAISGPDPYAVTKRVNTLAKVFVAWNVERKLDTSQRASAWLSQEVTTLKKSLQDAELALQTFIGKQGFVPNPSEGMQEVALDGYVQLLTSYNVVQARRIGLGTRLRELEKILHQSPGKQLSLLNTLNNPMISTLQLKYAQLEDEFASHSKRFQSKHPKISEILFQMRQLERKIESEVQKATDDIKTEYKIALAEEKSLKDTLDTKKIESLKINKDMAIYSILNHDVKSKRDIYESMLKRLDEAEITKNLQTNNIEIANLASVPDQPVPLRAIPKLFLGMILAVTTGAALIFVREKFDKKFKEPEEAEHHLDIPFLGVIPHYRNRGRKRYHLITMHEPDSVAANAYRNLWTDIQFSCEKQKLASIIVTSAIPGEGKSTIVANLGVTFAQLGKTVLLVDTDLRHSTLHQIFKLPNYHGISNILTQNILWEKVVQYTDQERLKAITSGSFCPNPIELLSSKRFQTFCGSVKAAFDIVIFDAPIALSIPDAVIVATHVDGILFAHNPHKGNKELAASGKQALAKADTNILGIVFNNVNSKEMKYYHSQYQDYGYRYKVKQPKLSERVETSTINMTLESNKIWQPEEFNVEETRNDLISIKSAKTDRAQNFSIMIHNVLFQENIADKKPDQGFHFIILDLELSNTSTIPYVVYLDSALICLSYSNTFGKIISKMFNLMDERDVDNEMYICRYDPITEMLEDGLKEKSVIIEKGSRRGRLAYQVPKEAENYIFVYETSNGIIRIPVMDRA